MNFEIQARPRSGRSGLFQCPCPRLDSDLKLSENQRDLPTTWLVNIKGLASSGYTSEYQAHYITTYIQRLWTEMKTNFILVSHISQWIKNLSEISFYIIYAPEFQRGKVVIL